VDVTDRKRREIASRFLAEASSALGALTDVDSALQNVATLAVPDFADWCAVDMADGDGGLRRVAVAHVDPAKVRLAHEIHRRRPPDPNAPTGVPQIIRSGRSELVADITDPMLVDGIKDPELHAIMRELGLRSYIGVPLTVRGKTLGAITFIAAESGRRYDAADLAAAEDLARRAAVAVENAQLYQAVREADRRKDEFLATLAHELRNPLAPIRNALYLLRSDATPAPAREQAREMMERQLHHLVRLVDDLLDVSRVMRGKVDLRKERVDVAAAAARAVETAQPLIDARRHTLTVNVPPDPVWVEADPVRLAQVVGNLLTNAGKYTDTGGRLMLTVEDTGGEAVIRVRDTGIGIARDMLSKVFDLFVQAETAADRTQGGLGIGLTLVQRLVELHGGTVQAHSEGPGRGSEFVVRLPLLDQDAGRGTRDEAKTGLPASLAPHPSCLPRRVLVVDDHADAADSLAMLLRAQGHAVRVARNGPDAVAAVTTDPPEVILLDLGMPGMDGFEVARQVRNGHGRGVFLVALTGWGQEEDRRRTREAGFDHHLTKPADPDELRALLTRPQR
jgi:signal transduction histidine kinase